MRKLLVLLSMLLCSAAVPAQVGISVELVSVNIGIDLPLFPELVPVPGYPVYYAPDLDDNYFFYDGMYWVYEGDNWYASSWYNGPWEVVEPEFVPVFILRVPVRYYRHAPGYFHGWRSDAPPRWDQHWGHDWAERRHGWDHWDRKAVPPRPPLPVYQRQYSGDRYPRGAQLQTLQERNYRYQPHDPLVRKQHEVLRAQVMRMPAQGPAQAAPQDREREHAPRMNERQNTQAPAVQNQAPTPHEQSPQVDRRPLPQEDRRQRQREDRPATPPSAEAPVAPRQAQPQGERPPVQAARPPEERHRDRPPAPPQAAPVAPPPPPAQRPAQEAPQRPQPADTPHESRHEQHDGPQGNGPQEPKREQRPDAEKGRGKKDDRPDDQGQDHKK
ncbi:MAG: hypothetical protein JWN23_3109 [Rhodocyclales bacterium]|nr:hypothetical protein [Rhodocyclales bacterium]